MASDNDASCICDPNFAVICSFLEKFGKSCGIVYPDFKELQEMIENTQEVSPQLAELHIKLLRKARKAVHYERWERALVKFCHTYSNQDGWEIERFGYKKSRIGVKLRVLKTLLELQFDFNQKFKNEINRLTAAELRLEPIGKDSRGQSYWYQVDDQCNLRVYREDLDEETWELVARDRDGLAGLITKLTSQSDSENSLEPVLNEDSNSLEIEKPQIDTGQEINTPACEAAQICEAKETDLGTDVKNEVNNEVTKTEERVNIDHLNDSKIPIVTSPNRHKSNDTIDDSKCENKDLVGIDNSEKNDAKLIDSFTLNDSKDTTVSIPVRTKDELDNPPGTTTNDALNIDALSKDLNKSATNDHITLGVEKSIEEDVSNKTEKLSSEGKNEVDTNKMLSSEVSEKTSQIESTIQTIKSLKQIKITHNQTTVKDNIDAINPEINVHKTPVIETDLEQNTTIAIDSGAESINKVKDGTLSSSSGDLNKPIGHSKQQPPQNYTNVLDSLSGMADIISRVRGNISRDLNNCVASYEGSAQGIDLSNKISNDTPSQNENTDLSVKRPKDCQSVELPAYLGKSKGLRAKQADLSNISAVGKRECDNVESTERKRLKPIEPSEEVSGEIVENVLVVRGEGSGADCQGEYVRDFDESPVSEVIEEDFMYFYGEGNGRDCTAANSESDKSDNNDVKSRDDTLPGSSTVVKSVEENKTGKLNLKIGTNDTLDNSQEQNECVGVDNCKSETGLQGNILLEHLNDKAEIIGVNNTCELEHANKILLNENKTDEVLDRPTLETVKSTAPLPAAKRFLQSASINDILTNNSQDSDIKASSDDKPSIDIVNHNIDVNVDNQSLKTDDEKSNPLTPKKTMFFFGPGSLTNTPEKVKTDTTISLNSQYNNDITDKSVSSNLDINITSTMDCIDPLLVRNHFDLKNQNPPELIDISRNKKVPNEKATVMSSMEITCKSLAVGKSDKVNVSENPTDLVKPSPPEVNSDNEDDKTNVPHTRARSGSNSGIESHDSLKQLKIKNDEHKTDGLDLESVTSSSDNTVNDVELNAAEISDATKSSIAAESDTNFSNSENSIDDSEKAVSNSQEGISSSPDVNENCSTDLLVGKSKKNRQLPMSEESSNATNSKSNFDLTKAKTNSESKLSCRSSGNELSLINSLDIRTESESKNNINRDARDQEHMSDDPLANSEDLHDDEFSSKDEQMESDNFSEITAERDDDIIDASSSNDNGDSNTGIEPVTIFEIPSEKLEVLDSVQDESDICDPLSKDIEESHISPTNKTNDDDILNKPSIEKDVLDVQDEELINSSTDDDKCNSKPLLMCVDINKLKETLVSSDMLKPGKQHLNAVKNRPMHSNTSVRSDDSVLGTDVDSTDVHGIVDIDPLAVTEEDVPIAPKDGNETCDKNQSPPSKVNDALSLTNFKLDVNEEEAASTVDSNPTRRRTRRNADQSLVELVNDGRKRGRNNLEGSADEAEGGGKRRRMRNRRSIDVNLRKSVESKKQNEGSSSDDEQNKGSDKSANVEQVPTTPARNQVARRGRPRATPMGKIQTVTVEEPETITESGGSPIAESSPKPVPRRKRTRKMLGLDVEETEIANNEDLGSRVRQSRRIAQIKIKEQAERRKLEEITLMEMKSEQTKKKSKKHEDKDYKAEKRKRKSKNMTEDESTNDTDSIKKKKKKKKRGMNFDESRPWQSSSDSSSSNEDEEEPEEVEEEPSDEENLVFKSDHEFSPESDLEDNGEAQPLRRARTAKVESDAEEVDDEYACQKCSKSDHPEWILLCDSCDAGWHCSCLRPALLVIPEGDWFCPPCQHSTLISRLRIKLQDFDKLEKQMESEMLRKQRLEYVGISMSNVLTENEEELCERPESKSDSYNDQEDVSGSGSTSDESSESSASSEDESEPIYQLRERRQANSYRFNEYDDLINSAIQEELDAVKGAGNQGRGKDINTIVNAEKEEQLENAGSQENVDDDDGDEVKKFEKKSKPVPVLEFSEDEEIPVVKKVVGKKKQKSKLTSLDISSEDDAYSDEDFKGSSSGDDEDEFEDDMDSDDSEVVKARRKGESGPVRRSSRRRATRYDREFINDDSDDDVAPRKKKTRSIWDDSETEDSDQSWGGRKRTKQKRAPRKASSPKFKKARPKSKKKRRDKDDDDEEVRIRKPRIKYGGLDNDDDISPTRRTRGKKINYVEALGTDSEEEISKPIAKPLAESEEEYVVNEEDDDEEDIDKDLPSEGSLQDVISGKTLNISHQVPTPMDGGIHVNPSLLPASHPYMQVLPDPNLDPDMVKLPPNLPVTPFKINTLPLPVPGSKQQKQARGNIRSIRGFRGARAARGVSSRPSRPTIVSLTNPSIPPQPVPLQNLLPSNIAAAHVQNLKSMLPSDEEDFDHDDLDDELEDDLDDEGLLEEGEIPRAAISNLDSDELEELDDEELAELMMEEEAFANKQLELAAAQIAKEKKKKERDSKTQDNTERKQDNKSLTEQDNEQALLKDQKSQLKALMDQKRRARKKKSEYEGFGVITGMEGMVNPHEGSGIEGYTMNNPSSSMIVPASHIGTSVTALAPNITALLSPNIQPTVPHMIMDAISTPSSELADTSASMSEDDKSSEATPPLVPRLSVRTNLISPTVDPPIMSPLLGMGPMMGMHSIDSSSTPKRRGRGKGKKTLAAEAAAAAAKAAASGIPVQGLAEPAVAGSSSGPTLLGGKLGIATPPQPFTQAQPTPSVITRMLQSQPVGPSQAFGPPNSAIPHKYYAGSAPGPGTENQTLRGGPPPGPFPVIGPRSIIPSPYRPPLAGGTLPHYPPSRASASTPPPHRMPGASIYMSGHHPLDPSPSGGGPITITGPPRDGHSPALIPQAAASPLAGKGTPTPPPPPYSRVGPPPVLGRFPSCEPTSVGPANLTGPPPPLRHHIPFSSPGTHLQQTSPPPRPPGNFSPYHPPPPPSYHYGAYPPPPTLAAADDALPPPPYQGSPYPDHYTAPDNAPASQPMSDNSNSKPFEEDTGGEFGGLVSYFSSQREDDLDT